MDIKAIVGLGNPGSRYYLTRHSVGFRVVDTIADKLGASWRSVNSNLEVAEVNIGGKNIFLLKPQTFMNSSGLVIPFLLKKGISAQNILVVHDELEVAFGKTKLRQGGSARGHNGLKSIISICGADFWRLRFGIDRPENKHDVPDYVLRPFSEDKDEVNLAIENAADHVIDLLQN